MNPLLFHGLPHCVYQSEIGVTLLSIKHCLVPNFSLYEPEWNGKLKSERFKNMITYQLLSTHKFTASKYACSHPLSIDISNLHRAEEQGRD